MTFTFNDLDTLKKIKLFKKKFFHGKIINTPGTPTDKIMWAFQRMEDVQSKDEKPILKYFSPKPFDKCGELLEKHLIDHFQGRMIRIGNSWKGSLACVGKFEGDLCKWFCLDCDNEKAVAVAREKLIPVMVDNYGLDVIWEYSGNGDDKGHLWFLCDKVKLPILKQFVEQIFRDAEVNPTDRELDFELYPTKKDRNVIRLPGGVHLKTKKINPILWRSKKYEKVADILQAFIDAVAIKEDDMKATLKELPKELKLPSVRKSSRFYYTSRNLPLSVEGLPSVVRKVASNCQAVNQILRESVESNLLEIPGETSHKAGLYLWRLALYHDMRVNHNSRIKCDEGEKWVRDFLQENRMRSWDSHNWDKDKALFKENPEYYMNSCETLNDIFGMCEGCPFKNRPGFKNPRQFWQGTPILKYKEKDVKLVRHDEIRKDTFVKVKSRIKACLEFKYPTDILLASVQGGGKSYLIDQITIDLAKSGKNVLISVPNGNLAIEHKNRIEKNPDGSPTGIKAFVVMSQKNLFNYMDPGFDCPKSGEIERLTSLGFGSGSIKAAYCKNCPFAKDCPYPDQYKNVYEGEHKVVIMQHAYFSCRETLSKILKKDYDIMFIDEAFIDNCHKQVKISGLELEILDSFSHEIDWCKKLHTWLKKGGYPKSDNDKYIIKPTELQMEHIQYKMLETGCKWRIPEFIRYFNFNMYYDRGVGMHVFYRIPEHDQIPVRVFTDATPPLEYLKLVLDNPNIEVYGDDEVLDYRSLNPENKVVQILDGSVSKSALSGFPDEVTGEITYDKFFEIIRFSCDQALKHPDKKVLITTYADNERDKFTSMAIDWIKDNYPELEVGREPPARVCVSHMTIGTNKYEDYQIQILAAGVYRNGKHFDEELYKLRSIVNYWNRRHGRPIEANPYPYGVGPQSSIERKEVPLKRITLVNGKAAVFNFAKDLGNRKFEGFTYKVPANPEYDIIERFGIAKTQQAIRLRFNDSRLRIIYIFGNFYLPSFLITDNVLEDEVLGYLRHKDSTIIVNEK